MDQWISKNNPVKQIALAAGCTIVGLILMFGFRDFSGFGSNKAAGFFLGVLLFSIGLIGFLINGKQTVVVDPHTRCIIIEDINSFRSKKRVIPFDDVMNVDIGYLGKKSNQVTYYYLQLKLRSGEKYPLFAPGRFYFGGSDRSTVIMWKQRLEEYLGGK